MKAKIIAIVILIAGLMSYADPVIFTPGQPPFENNYKAILTPTQTSNFWGCVMMDPDLVLPSCTATQHIQGATILLLEDGSTKINLIWMPDPVANTNMMLKMKMHGAKLLKQIEKYQKQ